MSLEESLIYMSVTPIIYFGIIAVLEYKLISLLLAKMQKGKYQLIEDPYDEQVKREKHAVAYEITKSRNRCK